MWSSAPNAWEQSFGRRLNSIYQQQKRDMGTIRYEVFIRWFIRAEPKLVCDADPEVLLSDKEVVPAIARAYDEAVKTCKVLGFDSFKIIRSTIKDEEMSLTRRFEKKQ